MKLREEQLFWLFITCIVLLGVIVVLSYTLPDYIAWLMMSVRDNF